MQICALVYNEQIDFFRMLNKELDLSGSDEENVVFKVATYYFHHKTDATFINSLNELLAKFIGAGKLENWVKVCLGNSSLPKSIDIKSFFKSCSWLANTPGYDLMFDLPPYDCDEKSLKTGTDKEILDSIDCGFEEYYSGSPYLGEGKSNESKDDDDWLGNFINNMGGNGFHAHR